MGFFSKLFKGPEIDLEKSAAKMPPGMPGAV